MDFNKIVETEKTIYGINDSIDGKVVVQKIAARNQFGVCLMSEPLYIGIAWKKGDDNQLIVLDENGLIVLKTTRIVNIFIKEEKHENLCM